MELRGWRVVVRVTAGTAARHMGRARSQQASRRHPCDAIGQGSGQRTDGLGLVASRRQLASATQTSCCIDPRLAPTIRDLGLNRRELAASAADPANSSTAELVSALRRQRGSSTRLSLRCSTELHRHDSTAAVLECTAERAEWTSASRRSTRLRDRSDCDRSRRGHPGRRARSRRAIPEAVSAVDDRQLARASAESDHDRTARNSSKSPCRWRRSTRRRRGRSRSGTAIRARCTCGGRGGRWRRRGR